MNGKLRRREFLSRSALAAGAVVVAPALRLSAASANEKLSLAAVASMQRNASNIAECAKTENIVALCDVDADMLERAAAQYPHARKYRDFRVMLEKEAEKLDGVIVGTPDHCHAPAAAMALRLKKPVYCEKPLTHTVHEARTLAKLARENKLATQMGTQIHAGENYRRVVELVQKGAIGPVREVHVWVSAVYTGARFTTDKAAPKNLNWDLWLGPSAERPYSEGVHPFAWRKFWDYGTGALGDFGCHFMDLVHWALDLKHPTKISARGPEVDAVSCPAWCIADYEYPARKSSEGVELPPVHLTWYDGGKRPQIAETLKDKDGKPLDWKSAQLFIGERGMILSNYNEHRLLPAEKFADYQRPEPYIPRSIGHHQEWLRAIKDGGPTTCNFGYSGALTESVLLGTIAYRSGKALEFDAEKCKITNYKEVQPMLHKEYRKGWTL
ncbi:MAG: Gfo/Idh/MocA family oxidoreductase [Planctomycetia bacterium]|nr:Gfo/Idh/MocA family oxidoreductase [Planctomycetia bacterium]